LFVRLSLDHIKNMELHNPSHVSLPALKINKTRERQSLEDDTTVNNLIRSNLLLDKNFNLLHQSILKKSKALLQLIKLANNDVIEESSLHDKYFDWKYLQTQELSLITHLTFKGAGHKLKKNQKKDFEELKTKVRKGGCSNIKRKMETISRDIQNEMSAFESKRKVELSILSSTTAHLCKKCIQILSLNKFKRCTCYCGEKIVSISQVKQLPIHHLNERIIKFLELNYWFEHGADYILRRKNYQTLVGYHVLGHSGVWHEIDNIAESKNENYRFFGECKNADVKVNDIFIFSGKMADIGCTRGYVFTTSGSTSKEINRLARSRNISIISNILKKNEKDLLKELKDA